MATSGQTNDPVAVFRLLGNAKRFEIIGAIANHELCVGDIAQRVGLSQSALSQHLAKLRDARMVTTRRDAQTIFYSCKDRRVLRIFDCAVNAMREQA